MRPLWFVAGAGAGVYVALKARRAAEALTPEGLQDRLAGLQVGWHLFSEEVRAGMQDKEHELRDRMAALSAGEDQRALPPGAGDLPHPHHPTDPTEERPHDGQQ